VRDLHVVCVCVRVCVCVWIHVCASLSVGVFLDEPFVASALLLPSFIPGGMDACLVCVPSEHSMDERTNKRAPATYSHMTQHSQPATHRSIHPAIHVCGVWCVHRLLSACACACALVGQSLVT